MLKRILAALRRPKQKPSSTLSANGERVDINLTTSPNTEAMDMYEVSHYKRYLFAKQYVVDGMVCGDFACGSGYGSVLLGDIAQQVIGIDISQNVIDEVTSRYLHLTNIKFFCKDLRNINFIEEFDLITSFETIEHVAPNDAVQMLKNFSRGLKQDGTLIFSTPYLQKRSNVAIKLGFHLTFNIDEAMVASWLDEAGLFCEKYYYQNYITHEVTQELVAKDFIICIAKKK